MSAPPANPKAAPRVALVTGASSGLGAAIARTLGARGWAVALGARRLDRLEATGREVESGGGKAFFQQLDVADEASIDAFVAAAEARLGPLDAVVSNAGIGRPGAIAELDAGELRAELDTNLLGPLLLARRVLPGLLERQSGDLCFVSSLNAVVPRPLQAGYTASKAGLEAAVRTLQMELEGSGVRATLVRPGPTRTELGWDWGAPMQRRVLEEWKRWGILRHHTFMPAEAVAEAVLAALTAPPGVQLDLIQLNPEMPARVADREPASGGLP